MIPDYAGILVYIEVVYAQAQNVFLFQGQTIVKEYSVKTFQIFVIQSRQNFN